MNSPLVHRQLRLLNQACVDTGWTLTRLAEEFGVAPEDLAPWLSGEVKLPVRWSRIEFLISLPPDLAERWVTLLRTT